ncbi:MAG: PVC-type heme-binding CxxCH protein [Verrucomicrobiota bacterium]
MARADAALAALAVLAGATLSSGAEAYRPVDTQTSGQPLPPRDAFARLRLPEGFTLTLAAAEPDVHQPIAIAHDERGRLWVAESYSYNGSDFTAEKRDRILILDDTDGDGVYETRKVFHDGLSRLTGLLPGFGGVWVTTAPTVSFIPDRNRDDVADGPPVVHLDGWSLKAEHNTVNGLTWGPDGWLYGRHGIKDPSRPGRPGVPMKERTEISCSIWRYHPVSQAFEIVAEGTVNPWGLDFDEHGQMFIGSSVVDHLWHVVPGARFKRALGREVSVHPNVYELMGPANDHSHRTIAKIATVAGASNAEDDDVAGGHSHSDAMIYLGDRWPEEYRGSVFMSNIHGRRVNRDRLQRSAGGGPLVATHAPDFVRANDPWFRAVSIECGPDGDVVMTDWSDNGECHDRDGVHRNSGRIYKISWGAPRRVAVDLSRASTEELVQLQLHRNDWYVRQARRLLQERAVQGERMEAAHVRLRELFDGQTTSAARLRALWALFVTGGADAAWLAARLDDKDEHVRYWAVRLLVDTGRVEAAHATRLQRRGETETSWLVQMALASALPALEDPARWTLGAALARTAQTNSDPNLLRLLWLGWQASIPTRAAESLALVAEVRAPRLQEWIARRLAEHASKDAGVLELLLRSFEAEKTAGREAILRGMAAGLEQRAEASPPAALIPLAVYFDARDASTRTAALALGAKLRSDAALEKLRAVLRKDQQNAATQAEALRALAAAKPPWLAGEVLTLVRRGQAVEPALRALATCDDPQIAPALLELYPKFGRTERIAAMDTLLARERSLAAVLDALEAGRLEKKDITQFQARQVVKSASPALRARFDALWGSVNTSTAAVAAQMRRLRGTMKSDFLALGDKGNGRTLFEQRCSACHTLFGKGGNLGPDLTGSGRKDLEYLVINITDPNAAIPADWRLAIATLADGRIVSGALALETESAVTLKTTEGPVTLERTAIRSLERASTSLMPTGLLDDLPPDHVRDLFAFLMSDGK